MTCCMVGGGTGIEGGGTCLAAVFPCLLNARGDLSGVLS